ncbi:QueT transporter family protein [Halopiger goleimassiliensis]|uniref:QueT transporter family protein n=1 Tax=Halopiger goleimassiliensis TaxID=1293048 RepID=UPI000A4DD4F1|nr:QueT transporter family protein [Halopiger goleimassiliensis]
MRELLTMWRDTRMIMLVAVVAAVYAALLIPFAGFVIIPGITSVRPGNVIPILFGVTFGPAAAWGSAIGNLINDIFTGQFGPGSAFGMVGNFFFGMLAYKLWGSLGPLSSGVEPNFRENVGRQLVEFVAVAVAASAACAAIIAWGLELLGLFPFSVLGTVIFLNNTIATVVLGPPLLFLTYPRIKQMGLLYPDLLHDEDLPDTSAGRAQTAAFGLLAISLAWAVVGIAISLGLYDVPFAAGQEETFQQGGATVQIALGAVAFLLLLGLTAISGERLSKLLE